MVELLGTIQYGCKGLLGAIQHMSNLGTFAMNPAAVVT
jgi:hypothetical protein